MGNSKPHLFGKIRKLKLPYPLYNGEKGVQSVSQGVQSVFLSQSVRPPTSLFAVFLRNALNLK